MRAHPATEAAERSFRGLAPAVEDEVEEGRSSSWKERRGGPPFNFTSAG